MKKWKTVLRLMGWYGLFCLKKVFSPAFPYLLISAYIPLHSIRLSSFSSGICGLCMIYSYSYRWAVVKLTCRLTAWFTDLIRSVQTVQKSPVFYGTWRVFFDYVHKIQILGHVLIQMSPVCNVTLSFKIYFSAILTSEPWFPKIYLPRFLDWYVI
jgi:hypothetical protein